MESRILDEFQVTRFRNYLIQEEKSAATLEKYVRDVRAFFYFTGKQEITKDMVMQYKKQLQERSYAVRSINSMLASINSFFDFQGWEDCKVKSLRVQREVYQKEEKELTKAEYNRLLEAAKGKWQLELILMSICSTGIRVSELRHFTVEEVSHGEIHVNCKGKNRIILIPKKLKKRLMDYAKARHISSGQIFLNKLGRPLNRSSIWAQMKALCKTAHVNPSKVFPHNLRKLFARTFYSIEKDIAKLADVLGHSSIGTTRIYIMTTAKEHRRQIETMGLVI